MRESGQEAIRNEGKELHPARWEKAMRARAVGAVLLAASTVALVCADAAAAAKEPFAISSFTTSVSTTQAGAHPDASTSIRFASHRGELGQIFPNQNPREVTVALPAGFLGNPTAVDECTQKQVSESNPACPSSSQVGVANELIGGTPLSLDAPVVNLTHGPNEVARLGLEGAAPVIVKISVRSGGDYGVTTTTSVPQAPVWGVDLTLWGVPAEHERGCQSRVYTTYEGVLGTRCQPATPPSPPAQWRPFLTNPTTCAGGPLTTTLSVNTFQDPGRWLTATSDQPQPTGCSSVAFSPSITVTPDSTQADAPAGYTFDLTAAQNEDPNGFASSQLREAVVTLPPGATLDPSAATGLQACTDDQFGMGATTPPSCPAASQIGTSEVVSPDLANPLHGQIYVGEPQRGAMYRVLQNIEGEGVDVKLEGRASPDPATGQITATFKDLPQLPFSEFRLHLRAGNASPLANPPSCGGATTTTDLAPWSGNADATPSTAFAVSSDGLGGACPALWPFEPRFSAGSNSLTAGAATTFSLTLARADRTQYLGGLSTHLPPGLVGDLAAVPLCPAAQAAGGTCPPSSAIGTVTTESGAGEAPFTLPGTVYLAQPRIANSPASLSVVVPAVAGPYNLGNVIVGADIRVGDDGSVTATSDPLPTILDGVPLRVRQIGLDITRPGFMLNPTSCAPMSVDATILSTEGQSAQVSSPFQLTDCQSLPFSPRFTATIQAKTSKANGASLATGIAAAPGHANIAKVDVALPKQLPSRLTTLQKACPEVQFASNPAGCPAASIVGTASARTPLLNGPLSGPAMLVSHGGAAFPDLAIVLQGQGITVKVTGSTDIKGGVTYARFESLPDVPVSSFQLTLPAGPYSMLGSYLPAKARGSLCGQRLAMPTTITGQNGAQVTVRTPITVAGCPKARPRARRAPRRRHRKP
jgi:hypothetical protein